jgi:putative ABC transport system permease protein
MGEIARTVGALLALGVVAVLRAPLAVLAILVVMVVAATFMVTARLTGIAVRDHWLAPSSGGRRRRGQRRRGGRLDRLPVGALIFDVRNLVAYGGITIGGAMTASTLTGRRFADRQAGRPGSRAGSSSTRQAGHRRRGPPGGR